MADGYCADDILDAALVQLRETVNYIYLCTGNPQSYTEAVNQKMAERAIDKYSFTDPAPGADGRKITLYEQTNLTVDTAGYARYVCFINTSTGELRYSVRKSLAKYLSSGTVMDISAADITFKYQRIVS